MRTHGTLLRWDAARGFGFIQPAGTGGEVFVHISAFPKDGRPPAPGELLSFEIEPAPDGRTRAARVMRTGRRPDAAARPARASAPRPAFRTRRRGRVGLVAAVVLALAAVFGWQAWSQGGADAAPDPADAAPGPLGASLDDADVPSAGFQCDGRTRCPQMSSCAEARYFVRHCPGTEMDGDGDGEPCEQQWCD